MSYEIIFFAILGTLFYEAVRIYRCIVSGSKLIPDVGLRKDVTLALYVGAVLVFILVSGTVVVQFEIERSHHAFFLGVGVPTGTRLISPPGKPTGEQIDDLASQEYGPKPSFYSRAKIWLRRYNV